MVADIAIVGGGPAGLVLAAICERQGLDYIVYERSARDTPPRGGCLDLHPGSGQRAMKEAGVFEEFKKYARGGDSSVHAVCDHKGNRVYSWGEGRDSPELDRHEIKMALLTGIPDHKILWRKTLKSVTRNESGKIVLEFTDGSVETGFKLVVGADGTFSKVRPLITPVNPRYTGKIFLTGQISKTNPLYPTVRKSVGDGPMVVVGRQSMSWCQIQGSGEYQISMGNLRPKDFYQDKSIDLEDLPAVKKLMLTDDFFGQHGESFQQMITAMDGPLRAWPLHEMPPEALCWQPSSDVTLIGDAAHTTTPFLGDGANCAMRDSIILAHKIKEFGFGQEAIGAYEEEMFKLARPLIENSAASGNLFFAPDAPREFVEAMEKYDFIGATDHQ